MQFFQDFNGSALESQSHTHAFP